MMLNLVTLALAVATDTSHVAMIKLVLRSEGFAHFRCDRSQQLGINTESLTKIFKCAENGDSIATRPCGALSADAAASFPAHP